MTDDLILPILTKLQSCVASVREEMAAMRVELRAELGDGLASLRTEMTTRFNAVDRRFDTLEDRVESLEHHAAVSNSKLDAIHARMQSTEVVRDEAWAQVAASASFTNRFEQRYAAQLAVIRGRLDRFDDKK